MHLETSPQPCRLEQHLCSMAVTSEAAHLLYGIWILDKQALICKLSMTSPIFYTYSDHGPAHSQNILLSIERILGDRVKVLGPTDTWLLLESAYRHDIGMQVPREDIKAFVKRDCYPHLLKELHDGQDEELRKAADVLLHQNPENVQLDSGQYASNILWSDHQLQTVLSQHYRNTHGENAEKNVLDEEKHPAQSQFIPVRLWGTVGRICKGHAGKKEDIVNLLPQFETGVAGDNVHPRFLQILLRLGDLLDLDNNRFNPHQLALWGNDQPRASKLHQLKHKALHHLYISPDRIEITEKFRPNEIFPNELPDDVMHVGFTEVQPSKVADCKLEAEKRALVLTGKNEMEILQSLEKEPVIKEKIFLDIEQREQQYLNLASLAHDAFRICVSWFNYLKDDLDYFALNWRSIVPTDFPGWVPKFADPEIWWKDNKVDINLLLLTYSISHPRAASIIQGTGLYGNLQLATNLRAPLKSYNMELTFIRELVQNAMDATKIQVFRDLKQRRYGDPVLLFGNDTLKWEPLKVLYEIGDSIERKSVVVRVYYSSRDDSKYRLRIKFIDVGTGIDAETLKNMSRIGNTRNQALEYEITQMPEWLKPNGSFGIGMQSVFGVVDEFRAQSGSRHDHVIRDLFFRNAKNGSELFAMDRENNQNHSVPYGTEIIIDLDDDAIAKFLPKRMINPFRKMQTCDIIFNAIDEQIRLMLGNDVFPIRVCYYVNQVEVTKRAYKLPGIFSELLSLNAKKLQDEKSLYNAKKRKEEEPLENVSIRFSPTEEEPLSMQVFDPETSILLEMYLGNCSINTGSETESGIDEQFMGRSAAYPINLFYRGLPVPQVELLNQMPFPGWRLNAYVYRGDAQNTVGISRNQLLPGVDEQLYPLIYNAADKALTKLWMLLDENRVHGVLDDQFNILNRNQKNALTVSLLYHRFFSHAGVPQLSNDERKYAKLQQYFYSHTDCAIKTLTCNNGYSETNLKLLRDFMSGGFERCWFIAPEQMPLPTRAMKMLDDDNLSLDEVVIPQDIFTKLAAKRGISLHASRVSSVCYAQREHPLQNADDPLMNPDEALLFPLIFQFGGAKSSTPTISDTLLDVWRTRIIDFTNNNLTPYQRPILPGIGRFSCVCLPCLPENLYQDALRPIGSYFVCPFTYQQIYDILQALNEIKRPVVTESPDEPIAGQDIIKTEAYQKIIVEKIDKLESDSSFKALTAFAFEQFSKGNQMISTEQATEAYKKAAWDFIAWLMETKKTAQVD